MIGHFSAAWKMFWGPKEFCRILMTKDLLSEQRILGLQLLTEILLSSEIAVHSLPSGGSDQLKSIKLMTEKH